MTIEFSLMWLYVSRFLTMYLLTLKILTIGFAGSYHAHRV